MNLKGVLQVVKKATKKWGDDNAARLGAALSYYTIFAIPPLFVIIIFVASLLLDPEKVRSGLFSQVGGLIGEKGAQAIQSALNATNPQASGLLASGLAIGALILSASGLFIELQSDLNKIWGVRPKPGQGIGGFLKLRLLSFSMVVGIGFLLMVSLAVSAAVSAFGHYLGTLLPGLGILSAGIDVVFSLSVITLLFAMIFKVLPDVRLAWRDVWVGAAATAALFTVGKFGLGLYLGKNSSVSAYGAAGSLVLILLWVYYSAQILFFGAEVTRSYAESSGAHLRPKAHAEWVPGTPRVSEPTRENKKKGPDPAVKPDRRFELVEDLRRQVHSLREQTEH